jgi:hypothetical protein
VVDVASASARILAVWHQRDRRKEVASQLGGLVIWQVVCRAKTSSSTRCWHTYVVLFLPWKIIACRGYVVQEFGTDQVCQEFSNGSCGRLEIGRHLYVLESLL